MPYADLFLVNALSVAALLVLPSGSVLSCRTPGLVLVTLTGKLLLTRAHNQLKVVVGMHYTTCWWNIYFIKGCLTSYAQLAEIYSATITLYPIRCYYKQHMN